MNRIQTLKKFISIDCTTDHVTVTMVSKGRKIVQQTSVTSDLSKFERDAAIVHFYKKMVEAKSNAALKSELNCTNYAEIFGSPWELGAAK
jgi:hypothetical protein